MSHLTRLPDDLLCSILQFLDTKSLLCEVSSVSSRLHETSLARGSWRVCNLTRAAHTFNLNDAALSRLAKSSWGNLTVLNLSRLNYVHSAGLELVWSHCASLSELRLRGCKYMSDNALPRAMPRCAERLTVLDLSENPEISAKSLTRLVSYLPQLRVLNLSSMASVTDDLLAILPRSCRHLEKLVLRRCPSFTNRGLAALSMLPKLRRLDVSNVAGVTAAGFVSLLGLDHTDESHSSLPASAQALLLEANANMASIAEWSTSGFANEPADLPSASSSFADPHNSISVAAGLGVVRPVAMSARALELFHNRRRDEWQRHIASYYGGQEAALDALCGQSSKDVAHSLLGRKIGVPISLPSSSNVNAQTPVRHSIRALKASSCDGLNDEAIHAMTFSVSSALPTCSRHDQASRACSDSSAECDAQCCADSSWSKLVLKNGHFSSISLFALLSVSQHSLTELDLSECTLIDNNACKGLALFGSSIKTLILSRCTNIRGGFKLLRFMPSLTSLNLNDCTGLSSEAIVGLAGACSDLRQLQISRCTQVSDSALASLLGTTPLLERLNIDGCSKVGNEALLAACFNCPLLRELHCWNVSFLSDETLECFVSAAAGRSACSALETLDLGECTALTASALAAFFRITPRLKSLDITSCKLNDDVLLSIGGAHQLAHLSLSKCTGVTDAGIVAIADGCRQLVHLDLNSCSDITGDALQALNVGCASLKKPLVNLSGCPKISDVIRRKWLLASPGPSADAASKRASPPPFSSAASAMQSPAGSTVLISDKASAAHAAATATPSPLPEPFDHSSIDSSRRTSAGTRSFPLTFESKFSSSSSSAQGASSAPHIELSEQTATRPSKRSRH